MNRTYNLDPESAKQAGASNYINETGKYIGHFTRAEAITSKQGTEGIEFTFKAQDGRTADFLTCWTYNTDGKELYGLKMLNALMTCMRVKSLVSKPMTFQNKDGAYDADGFPDLMIKPIGLLLQREEYLKNNGQTGYKFNIFGCFDAATDMTAGEILDRAGSAERLKDIVKTLKDRPMQAQQGRSQPAPAMADIDDDIPW